MHVDIDECFQAFINGESVCPSNQICQNIPGGYRCSCPAGTQLQNSLCVVGMSISNMTPFYYYIILIE